MTDDEERLNGGNASGAVVRVGATVRKAWTAATPSVEAYMNALSRAGVDVPKVHGRDDEGRRVVDYVPGPLAVEKGPLSPAGQRRVGALVRAIHDASEHFVPSPSAVWESAIPAPPSADLVCHNDLAPWNLVIGDRWVFIDWDAAAPSTRLWDLAYAAHSFALGDTTQPPGVSAANLVAFLDGYGADARLRRGVAETMLPRVQAMASMLRAAHEAGREPWATMFANGHGAHWDAAVAYVDGHRDLWRRAALAA